MKTKILEDIIDTEVLQSILEKFCLATGLASVAVNYKGEPITEYINFSPYCLRFRNNAENRCLCYASDAHGGVEAARLGKAHIYRCHSGLTDMAVPIIYDGRYLGAILAGQVRIQSSEKTVTLHPKVQAELQTPATQELFNAVPYTTLERVSAAADLIYLVANYIVSVGMNKRVHEELKQKNLQLISEIDTRTDLERLLKDAEIRLLQSQVNPHFLFNVLNTINSLAVIENADMTSEIVHTLAEMLRYTLKNTFNDLVPLRAEIEYTEKYVAIQKVRIGDRIRVEIQIPDEYLELETPYMIIQPLVANAIVHGLYEKESAGIVSIDLDVQGSEVEICVSDNGVGVDPTRLKSILETEDLLDDRSTGVGLRNTHRRLQYRFGAEYGVTIESVLEHGTRVKVRFPIR